MKKTASVLQLFSHGNGLHSVEQLTHELESGKKITFQETVDVLTKAAQLIQGLPKYDVVGMDNLVERLREELANISERKDGLDSINKLSMKINVSRTHLSNFRDGGMVCMNIMNRLTAAFNIRYLIENYKDHESNL
ncbi:MAG: hypothetical protein L3J98_06235 [Gammaproteobacteria bacterium]|nr:hypothetical protein [Gammaproteobacteria bacterium]MCF6259743.1 hypothetical protein [Gammaproteobacteria bacterium]